jgi:hypothetical protein
VAVHAGVEARIFSLDDYIKAGWHNPFGGIQRENAPSARPIQVFSLLDSLRTRSPGNHYETRRGTTESTGTSPSSITNVLLWYT